MTVGFLAIAGYLAAGQYALRTAYESGRVEVVEGSVEVVAVQPERGHGGPEVVRVDSRTVTIDRYKVGFGYRETAATGGHIKQGKTVRLFISEGAIARVDVRNK